MKDNNENNTLFLQLIDYLKEKHQIPTTVSSRRIGMDKHKIQNIRRGGSSAKDDDIQKLFSIFPELAHFKAQLNTSIPNPTTAQEAPATYHTTPSPTATAHTSAPEGILPALARIEATQQELLHHLLERSRQDAATIQRLLAIIEATTTTTPR